MLSDFSQSLWTLAVANLRDQFPIRRMEVAASATCASVQSGEAANPDARRGSLASEPPPFSVGCGFCAEHAVSVCPICGIHHE